MVKNFDFDLIIIGSGAAGSAAAFSAAATGLNVAIVEAGKWGGSALNSRDLPFRAATSFSQLYFNSLHGVKFGLSTKTLRFNYPTVLNWQALAKKRSGAGSKKAFEQAGITCLKGLAHFLSPYELSVNSVRVSAPKFIIASGAEPNLGGVVGCDAVKYLTPDSALSVPRPPKTLLIAGAGATGCEFATYFTTLGTKVCLMELSDHILPKEDIEAQEVLEKYLTDGFGIKVLTESRLTSISPNESGIKATYLRGGKEKSVVVDEVLLATGSSPALDLGLENAGIKFDQNGIIVNNLLQTSMKHIWAAGDCIGGNSSSERASYEGALAAANALSHKKNLVSYTGFPRCVQTFPGVATVGLTESDCLAQHKKYRKSFIPLSAISASNTSDFRIGFLKLLSDTQGKIIGATVMCPEAELIVSELALAVRHHLSAVELASTPHVASSWSELVRLAAKELAKS
ncbi:NAD(P)/FAD-dependent oxidoreductase [Candidatus Saccharibacteria bacterium]|nr:NAD(P)/FAD-dependent oxidoreductase [Candidatus Saccharibacteria bacterium]